jgi:hypothetical protein
MTKSLVVLGLMIAAACAPKRIQQQPIMQMGDIVPNSDARVAAVAVESERERDAIASRRDSIAIAAVAGCTPAICDAVGRGELALGMNEAQVLAATRTTEGAWRARRSTGSAVLVPLSANELPRDMIANVAMVQLRNGQVTSYTYRDARGLRVVDSPADATGEARTTAIADALIREGDDLAANGNMEAALDRYDRASTLKPRDVMLEYRIASILDRSLRPVEALVRYKRFLHQLELEKIEAHGDAYAKLADAIARARERVIILEKR